MIQQKFKQRFLLLLREIGYLDRRDNGNRTVVNSVQNRLDQLCQPDIAINLLFAEVGFLRNGFHILQLSKLLVGECQLRGKIVVVPYQVARQANRLLFLIREVGFDDTLSCR